MKWSKLGLILGGISLSVTSIVLFIVYSNAKQTHGESAWLVAIPLVCNLPTTMLVVFVRKAFRAPDYITGPLLAACSFLQWYLVGYFISAMKSPRQASSSLPAANSMHAKKCPKCNKGYDSSWVVCLDDREQLVSN